MTALETLVEPLLKIDWDDTDAVEAVAEEALKAVAADGRILREALAALAERPDLQALCEHPDPQGTADLGQQLDKVVLYADPDSGVRVRLHAFWPGYYDLPHNHRWTFASLVMRGRFRHRIYGDQGPDDAPLPVPLLPLHVRHEEPGNVYALHHRMLHALIAEPGTVSLVVRGPAAKDRSFLVRESDGARVWHVGASNESSQQLARKRMSPARLAELTELFGTWGLLG
ncbi:hypothetical protein [Cellulomonas timonensis]|uniref:hypothetical protein n=1 Tax=Cellulomonas timonensis TaxID=1689271 RepID=UPI00082CD44A|nr:hypothetical protein [Cellulomonas timonensis]